MANSMLIATKFIKAEMKNYSKLFEKQALKCEPFGNSVFSDVRANTKNCSHNKTSWFSKLFNRPDRKLIDETKKFIDLESEMFYQKQRKVSEILKFETNKTILSELLNKSPNELSLSKKEYKNLVNLIKENGLEIELKPENITSESYKTIISDFKELYELKWANAEQIYYKQHGMLNPNLSEIKANISAKQIKLMNTMPTFAQEGNDCGYSLHDVKNLLSESKKLTLENGSLIGSHYSKNDVYDLPFKFASASYNSLAKNGNAYINADIPNIFKGINEKELYESLDLFSTHVRGRIMSSFPKNSVIKLKIGNKNFDCTSLGHGLEGNVFRISAEGQKPVIFKTFYADSDCSQSLVSFAPSGLYGGMGILREANIAKVVDVPRLHMANPIYKPVNGTDSRYMGAWQVVEDASTRKSVAEGLKYRDWLKEKGLTWVDDKADAWVNGICVDTGFVTVPGKKSYFNNCWGDREINDIYSKYLNGETTGQILEFLK